MAWDDVLRENGAYNRCETEQEWEDLRDGYADHLRDQRKDRPNFGPNGPTGHGDICHSDADEGL